tara:strand:+ start:238 stop:369 length:132 start_codon:yes stop_codon:yes gene_type:complete
MTGQDCLVLPEKQANLLALELVAHHGQWQTMTVSGRMPLLHFR